jgi:uncharacterized protein (TIGR02996 family)
VNDKQAFLNAIHQQPGDDTARLAFADWLDDRTDPSAAGWRAMVRMGKHPDRSVIPNGAGRTLSVYGFHDGTGTVWITTQDLVARRAAGETVVTRARDERRNLWEVPASEESRLPELWYNLFWDSSGDKEAKLTCWVIGQHAGELQQQTAEVFLSLPDWERELHLTGLAPPTASCPDCKGTGNATYGDDLHNGSCSRCIGTGRVKGKPCLTCVGKKERTVRNGMGGPIVTVACNACQGNGVVVA